jgi:hypothetical protein
MYKSKLVEIFSTLSSVEQNRLVKFAHSPYHNQHKEVQLLLQYLLQTDTPRLEQAFHFVFGAIHYQPQKIRNTMSYLQKLIDKFLIYEQLEKEESLLSNTILLKIYRQRQLDKCFKSTLRISNTLHQKMQHRDTEYYYYQYNLQQEEFLFANEKNRLEEKNVQEVLDSFDIFYIVNKLKYSVTALTHQNIFSTSYELHLIPSVLQHIITHNMLSYPNIAAYYYSYNALVDNSADAFFDLKRLLIAQSTIFKTEELKQLYIIAINFCIKHLNKGEEDFVAEIYELYKSGLLTGIFIEKGYISRFTYKNIVAIGLKSKDYTWVKGFIQDYAIYLHPKYKTSYYDYNLAKWYYIQKDYKAAMHIFLTLDNTDRIVVIDSKVTLLKIYYEIEEYDALDALIESFKVYIKRSKGLSAYLKKSYLNLISYLRKVLQLNFYDKEKKQALIDAIQTEQHLPEKQWVISLLKNL